MHMNVYDFIANLLPVVSVKNDVGKYSRSQMGGLTACAVVRKVHVSAHLWGKYLFIIYIKHSFAILNHLLGIMMEYDVSYFKVAMIGWNSWQRY